MHRALIIANSEELACALPYLLNRSGFLVDVVSKESVLSKSRFVQSFFLVPPPDSTAAYAAEIVQQQPDLYDWILVGEDHLLTDILHLNVLDDIKLKMLPVMSEENYGHLYSKIGLAKTFLQKGISSPDFRKVTSLVEAEVQATKLGYPVMLKLDASNGGVGVRECHGVDDIRRMRGWFNGQSLLLQKKIDGNLVDVSAIYLHGKLIHFSYSIFKKSIKSLGPSSLRDYTPLRCVDKNLFDELQKIGNALGAHGLTNITCIEAENGVRHYFEADMRPNVWADMSRFLGDDAALFIKEWFASGACLTASSNAINQATLCNVRMPYFGRLSSSELLTNRDKVWTFIPREDWKMILSILWRKISEEVGEDFTRRNVIAQNFIRENIVDFIRDKIFERIKTLSNQYRNRIRSYQLGRRLWPYELGRLVVPVKYRDDVKILAAKIGFYPDGLAARTDAASVGE
jgi:hypothetical protein